MFGGPLNILFIPSPFIENADCESWAVTSLPVVFVSGEQSGGGKRGMGYLWRVRLSSFAAGAAAASGAGFFLLYKDHLLARATIARQVEEIKETSEKHYEALNKRISALESRKEPGAIKEASD
ncbi:hypothetical protein PAHAL_5G262500 [Panicum hallii]|uniref:Uncharacterized protein n=2 Tax=Panicum hallii TaxID=206008 RepID=A0A2T8ILA2_9POAL|nr:hypothetical protein PAHAL_5G262500 [Panicum hallii]